MTDTPFDQDEGVFVPTTLEASSESRSDHFFKWAMRVAVIAVVVIAVATYFTTRSSSVDSDRAATDAAATRVIVESIQDSLDAQQIVVDRSGCVAGVYSRFYLAIAEVIIQEDTRSQKMQDSREELRDLIAGDVCPIPDLEEEVGPPAVPEG